MRTKQTKAGILVFLVMAAILSTGCMRINTVPAWKGIPAQLVSPTSQEAMAWRDGMAARRAQRHGH